MEKEFDLLAKFRTILADVAQTDFWSMPSAAGNAQAPSSLSRFATSLDLWGGLRDPRHIQIGRLPSVTGPIQFCIKLLGGGVFADISMPRSGTVQQLREHPAMQDASATPCSVSRLKLVFGDETLPNNLAFGDFPFRNLSRVDLQLIRCQHSFDLGPPSPAYEVTPQNPMWDLPSDTQKATMCDHDRLFTIVVVGPSGSGKTPLVEGFCHDTYSKKWSPTNGVDFKTRSLVANGTTHVKLHIWDTAGPEPSQEFLFGYGRSSERAKGMAKKAHAFIVNFDVTDQDSFEDIDDILAEIREYGRKDCIVSLVGSMADESGERRVAELKAENSAPAEAWAETAETCSERCFTEAEVLAFAAQHGLQYSEVDAKTGYGVHKLLFNITGQLLDRFYCRSDKTGQTTRRKRNLAGSTSTFY